MSLLDLLSNEETWAEFREYKSLHSHMSNREFALLDEYIAQKRYLNITDHLSDDANDDMADSGSKYLRFSFPNKRVINKSGTKKKRVVYMFPEDETWVLKLLAWLLYKYDGMLSDSCFSFRRQKTVRDAIDKVLEIPDLENRYVLKMDIHNYFNSMPTEGMIKVVREVITDDEPLCEFLCDFLSVNRAVVCDSAGEKEECSVSGADVSFGEEKLQSEDKLQSGDNRNEKYQGEKNQNSRGQESSHVIVEERGAMAGMPVSAFMANIYLLSLDREFEGLGIAYFRYSDDIIIFARTDAERQKCRELVERRVAEKGLAMNPDKLALSDPGEPWEFLGFEYRNGRIDLSHVTIAKMKAKIKRKCRAIYRWRIRKNVDFDHAAAVAIRVFNRKFFDVDEEYDFTWSRWFFPILTTDEGLHTLDEYLVSELRFMYSGRHYKGNYAVTYDHLKELGLRSLVHEFYDFRAN